MTRRLIQIVVAGLALVPWSVGAQSPTDMNALRGLAPVTTLLNTRAGKAALSANFTVTAGIQMGTLGQPGLIPFPEQQQQALRDAFITGGNLAQLADGLGTTLGAAYVARVHYIDRDHFTPLPQEVAELLAYANLTTESNSNASKYFFANQTADGKASVSSEALKILEMNHGTADIFGIAYGKPAKGAGADINGNSRPFQTEPDVLRVQGRDYLNTPSDNYVYNRGPVMDLTNSPSYPSGHTTYGYTGSLILAILVPERYQEMVTRGAEYGNSRILLGAHYAMDVIGGRTLALYDIAHLIANDPAYVGQSLPGAPVIHDFPAAVKRARSAITEVLKTSCNKTIAVCAREDIGRFSDAATNDSFYASTQTYGLPIVYSQTADKTEDIGKLAPEAGYLLTIAFPALSLEQADKILTETEGPGGGFLDDGSGFGVYSRIHLYAAAGRAAAISATK
jgi:hypothetical protein